MNNEKERDIRKVKKEQLTEFLKHVKQLEDDAGGESNDIEGNGNPEASSLSTES